MTHQSAESTEKLVKGLGAASFGLGLSEVLGAGKVAEMAGIDNSRRARAVIRVLGLRELGHAAALTFGPRQLVWTRVAGDGIDLALLRKGMTQGNGSRRRGTVSTAGLAAIAAADIYASWRTTRNGGGRHAHAPSRRVLRASTTVRRTPDEVYRFWRDLENLPSFMGHLQQVTAQSDDRSHWVANAPIGQPVQWDARITEDVPNERIAWTSLPGGLENAGSVVFTPTPDASATEIRVTISYHIPAAALGKVVATLLGESPEQQVNDDLRRLKQILETGEIVRSDGSPEGTASIRQMHQRPAQPLSDGEQQGGVR